MTDIEKKALALVNEVEGGNWLPHETDRIRNFATICRAIEQHEAFKREVSDAVESRWMNILAMKCEDVFSRFIIPKTDPLVEALLETFPRANGAEGMAADLRAAIEARGGRIVWEGE